MPILFPFKKSDCYFFFLSFNCCCFYFTVFFHKEILEFRNSFLSCYDISFCFVFFTFLSLTQLGLTCQSTCLLLADYRAGVVNEDRVDVERCDTLLSLLGVGGLAQKTLIAEGGWPL